ncbi:MAG TPA: Uma2 family endonuclease [Isosphaeraceae bacterium]|nr:Uma2 family endonuclease [Isosphaeraceae bacterium]
MSTQTRLITADEFLEWPDEPGCRQELIRGEVVTMSLPGGRHGKVAGKILRRLGNHVEAAELGDTYTETGFIVERDPDTVKGPDVAFVRSERLATIGNPEKHIPFAPDLAVEVKSPNDRDDEVEEKVQLGLRAGALMVWTVDPESRTVTIYRPGIEPVTLTEDETIRGDDVIPGFECRVGDFFR